MTDLAVLNHAEQVALEECERVIGEGIKTFVAVGSSLSFVRDNKLYRGTHQTFEAYARERWNLSRTRSYELMEAAEVVSAIADTGQAPPENEAQARQLARVSEPERAEVWRETVERTEGKPTAKAVREVAQERTQPPSPDPKPDTPTADPVANVAAALDKYVPDPDGPARKWRLGFWKAVTGSRNPLLMGVDDTAEYADDLVMNELRELAEGYTNFLDKVRAARAEHQPDNVRPLRRVQ